MTLPPDPDLATYFILRAHYQRYHYLRYLQEKISPIPFQDMGGSLIVDLILLGECGLKKISYHHCQQLKTEVEKKKKVESYEGNVKDEYNVEKSRSLKSCKATLSKKNACDKNKKSSFLFTDRNDDIDSQYIKNYYCFVLL